MNKFEVLNFKKHIQRTHELKNATFVGNFFWTCRKFFWTEDNLKKHIQKHMKKNCCGKIFKCKLCGKIFQTEGNLKKHIKKKLQFFGENVSDQRQFEDIQKTPEEKSATFVGKFSRPKAIWRNTYKKHMWWRKNCNFCD